MSCKKAVFFALGDRRVRLSGVRPLGTADSEPRRPVREPAEDGTETSSAFLSVQSQPEPKLRTAWAKETKPPNRRRVPIVDLSRCCLVGAEEADAEFGALSFCRVVVLFSFFLASTVK